MGSYYAGSTILINGKFSTHDPAEDGAQGGRKTQPRPKSQTKKSRAASPKQKSKTKHNKALRPTAPGGTPKPRKFLAPARMRKLTVRKILRQAILGTDVYLPHDISEDLRDQIMEASSPEAWALDQPGASEEYQRIKSRMEKASRPVVEVKKRTKGKNVTIGKSSPTKETSQENTKSTSDEQPRKDLKNSSQYSLRFQKLRLRAITAAATREKTGSKKTKLPGGLPLSLKREIESDGSLLAWAKNQTEYVEIFSGIEQPEQKTAKEVTSLSPKQMMARGISRIILHDRQIPGVLLVEIIKSIGLLPTSPRFNVFAKGATKSVKAKAKNIWLSSLDKAQMRAWSSLSKNQRNQYINTGRVDVGTPQIEPKDQKDQRCNNKKKIVKSSSRLIKTLSTAPTDFILKQIRKDQDEDFDYKKIDWDST